jgi:hypothetical protein
MERRSYSGLRRYTSLGQLLRKQGRVHGVRTPVRRQHTIGTRQSVVSNTWRSTGTRAPMPAACGDNQSNTLQARSRRALLAILEAALIPTLRCLTAWFHSIARHSREVDRLTWCNASHGARPRSKAGNTIGLTMRILST